MSEEPKFYQKNAKMIMFFILGFSIVYIFFGLEESDWSIWIPIAASLCGFLLIQESFIEKHKVQASKSRNIGPEESFAPQGSGSYEYDRDQETGQMYPKKTSTPPTPRYREPMRREK